MLAISLPRVSPFSSPVRAAGKALLLCGLLLGATLSAGSSAPPRFRVDTDAPHAAQLRRLYADIPAVWRSTRVVRVREVSDRQMDRLVQENGDEDAGSADGSVVDGFFLNGEGTAADPDVITLRQSLPQEEMAFVFTHEYGHAVWNDRLSDEDQAEYTRLWQRARRADRLVTPYSRESEEEGFAEAFAHYLRRPSLLRRRDPAACRFLEEVADSLQSAR